MGLDHRNCNIVRMQDTRGEICNSWDPPSEYFVMDSTSLETEDAVLLHYELKNTRRELQKTFVATTVESNNQLRPG